MYFVALETIVSVKKERNQQRNLRWQTLAQYLLQSRCQDPGSVRELRGVCAVAADDLLQSREL